MRGRKSGFTKFITGVLVVAVVATVALIAVKVFAPVWYEESLKVAFLELTK